MPENVEAVSAMIALETKRHGGRRDLLFSPALRLCEAAAVRRILFDGVDRVRQEN
jgi:hypothetical protein